MSPMKRPAPPDEDFEKTLSMVQVCRRLGITQTRLHRLLAEERLDFVEIRGRIRVPIVALCRFEESSDNQ